MVDALKGIPGPLGRGETGGTMRLVWFGVLVLLLARSAAGRDVFVSNTSGDDLNTGTAMRPLGPRGGPVRTISKAVRLARPSDRIVLDNTGKPYRETVSLVGSHNSGGVLGPLVIEGRGALLDGTVPIPAQAWQQHDGDVYVYQPRRMGHQQLFLAGRQAERLPAVPSDASLPRLEPLQWCYWRGKIYFCTEPLRHPDDYEPSCCGLQTGITLYYVRDVLIRDLGVQGFALDGVAVHDVVRDTRLERVSARANGDSGLSVRGASWVELDQCTLADNGRAQLRIEGPARVWLYRCRLLDESAPAIWRKGGEIFRSPEPFALPIR